MRPYEDFDGHCARCRKRTIVTTMSWFNRDIVCMECSDLERTHPDFQRAHDVEEEEVRRGNFNYPGIGLPADFYEKVGKK